MSPSVKKAISIIIALYNDSDSPKGQKRIVELLEYLINDLPKTKREKALMSVMLHPLVDKVSLKLEVGKILLRERKLMNTTVVDLMRIASRNKSSELRNLANEIVIKQTKGVAKKK